MALNIDLVFSEIGEFGRGQRCYTAVLCLFNCYGAWHMMLYAFIAFKFEFLCQARDQDSPNYSECPANAVDHCQEITFDVADQSTIVSEWNLVCDRAWLGPLTMSVFMLGVMVGAFVMGTLADRIGRKRTLFICLTNMLIWNTFSGLVPSYLLHVGLKFFVGFFQAGYILTSFVLVNELIGSSWRGIVGNGIQVTYGFF